MDRRSPPIGRRPLAPAIVIAILAGLVLAAGLLSLNLGYIQLSPGEVVRTLAGRGDDRQELILFQFRLPRIVLAALIGAGLATSGAILQAVSRNDLADPGILGINAGAGLAVIGLLLAVPTAGAAMPFLMPLAAFAGAAATAALIYGLALKRGGITPARLLLVGIAVGIGISAAMLLGSLRMDRQLYFYAVSWLAGTIAGADWSYVRALLPWVVVLIPLTVARAQVLNVLNLGDTVATGLGAAVEWQRRLLLAVAVGLAGSAVAVGGGIAFVGLVGPHLARRLVGPNQRVLVPAAALAGAALLVAADMVGSNLLAPVEIPVGIVVSAVGAPYFLYLLVRAPA